jgi:hypothetical protein
VVNLTLFVLGLGHRLAEKGPLNFSGLRGLNAYLPRAQLSVLIGWHMSVKRFSKGLCQNKTENYS